MPKEKMSYEEFFNLAIPKLQDHIGLEREYALPVYSSGLFSAFVAYYEIPIKWQRQMDDAKKKFARILRENSRSGSAYMSGEGGAFPRNFAGPYKSFVPTPQQALANVFGSSGGI